MGRKPKSGLTFFYRDVDTWDDLKIMDLVNEYGPLGYAIYDIVVCKVYKNGYYLEAPLDKLATQIVRLIGNRWIKDKSLVLQVIQYCADIGLFDNDLLSQSVITSAEIQEHYSEVTARNKVDKSKYWLIEKNDSQPALINAPKNSISATEKAISATEINKNVADIPQSKVNESKVNESKKKVLYAIPCKNGVFNVDEDYYTELTHTYPNMNIDECFKKMINVLTFKPESQRYIKGMKGYITTWLDDDEKAGKYRKSNSLNNITIKGGVNL